MVLRNIVKIDEEKCDGCGLCVGACAEGAIKVIDGKARLVSEIYCDGLGACLGHCPQDAIRVEKREANEFDEAATTEHVRQQQKKETPASAPCQGQEQGQGFSCPGSMMRQFDKPSPTPQQAQGSTGPAPSQLGQWPVHLMLVSPQAPYFKNAHLLWTADCVPFAMADFHQQLLAGKAIAVGCPKLDDAEFYIEKLSEIIKVSSLSELTVVHMEVPCCSGMTYIAREAISRAGLSMNFQDITLSVTGQIIKTEPVNV